MGLIFQGNSVPAATTTTENRTDCVAGKTPSLEQTVLTILRQTGKAQRHDLLTPTGLSRSSLGRLLDRMEAKGLIRQEGERKASYYVLAEKSGQNL